MTRTRTRSSLLLAGAILIGSTFLGAPLPGRTSLRPAGTPRNAASSLSLDTLWFGGTTWDPVDLRWEAVPDSVWTFETGVGSSLNADPDVKAVGLHRTMEGWAGLDLSDRSSQLRFLGRTTLCAINGSWSLHAGATEAQADSQCWVSGQGYCNNLTVQASKSFAYPGSGSITLGYAYAVDAEAGYDHAYVLVDTTGDGSAAPVLVATHTGLQSGTASLPLAPGTKMRSTPGPFRITFQFVSDAAYSDEDGYYPTTCGHSTIDDISLSGAVADLSTFESGDDGWTVEPPDLVEGKPLLAGDWSDLEALADLPPPGMGNPCDFQDTVLVFFDPSVGSAGGHPRGQETVALSPWIDLGEAGLDPPYDVIVEYEGHFEMPFQSQVFVAYYLQWAPLVCEGGGGPVSGLWKHGVLDYSLPAGTLPAFACDPPFRRTIAGFPPAGAAQLRVGIGVLNLCPEPDFGPCDGASNSTPWIDNVRIGVVGSPSTTGVRPDGATASRPSLESPRPNPAGAASGVTLRFALPARGEARIEVYDVSGRLVRTVLDRALGPGPHQTTWDTRDDAGRSVASGLYFVRLLAAGASETRKLVIRR
jgi:hypothetical protein